MSAILIALTKDPPFCCGGVSVLQHTDDNVIFMEHDLEKAVNMKLIFCIFEHLSGLKINFYKSELFYFGKASDMEHQCKKKFLGVHLDLCHLDILASQSTTECSVILNGIWWKIVLLQS
jgi:hypothetical protein